MANKINSASVAGKDAERLGRQPEGERALTAFNYKLMALAGVVVIAGFLLMLGPGSTETEFNPDIFSVRRTVIGPGLSFLGYIFMGVAIMWNRRKS